MKKLVLSVITIILTTIAIVMFIYFYPKKVNINAQGIKYRLGTELLESEKLVNVNIEGKLYKNIFGERKFEGTIDIAGEEIPVPLDQRKLNILITNEGAGVINYPYFTYRKDNGATNGSHTYQYGTLVFNNDFTNVTILVSDQNKSKDNSGIGWNSESGQMITAPASCRIEAISITNEITEKFLKGLKLK